MSVMPEMFEIPSAVQCVGQQIEDLGQGLGSTKLNLSPYCAWEYVSLSDC